MAKSRRRRTLIQLAISVVVAIAMLGAFLAVGGVMGATHNQVALAKDKGGDRPGLGCGDKNHTHTGPPGNPEKTCKTASATSTSASSTASGTTTGTTTTGTTTGTTTTGTTTTGTTTAGTTAASTTVTSSTEGVRPGLGCGDKNHTHTGPPGNPGKKCKKTTTSTSTTTTTTATTTTGATTAATGGAAPGAAATRGATHHAVKPKAKTGKSHSKRL